MQGWKATTRHEVTTKKSTKRLKHTGNMFRNNLQLKGVHPFRSGQRKAFYRKRIHSLAVRGKKLLT